MIDQRAYQCNRRRSLVIWRGEQWSVTSNGIETTDTRVPHVVIHARDLQRAEDALLSLHPSGQQQRLSWVDEAEFRRAVDHAKMAHGQQARGLFR